MTSVSELQQRAQRRLRQLRRRRRDPRYVRVMGRFVAEALLFTNELLPAHHEPLEIGDVLWAGEVEPRLLELLPALIVKRPALFKDLSALPEDLARVVSDLRRDREPPPFRGLPGAAVYGWLARVGRVGKVPARLKSFRFTPEDQRLLAQLSKTLGLTETEVIRRALRSLHRGGHSDETAIVSEAPERDVR